MNFVGFMKIVGIVTAGFAASFGGMVGYIFATGGFEPPYIVPEDLYFDEIRVLIDDDAELVAWPEPKNSTELDMTIAVTGGTEYIEVEPTGKMGHPFKVTVKRVGGTVDGDIVGGEATIRVGFGVEFAEIRVFVDVPVDSFELEMENPRNIYVGDTFNVQPTNITPSNSVSPIIAGNSVFLQEPFELSEKEIRYYYERDEEEIIEQGTEYTNRALVDELTGEVTPIAEGTFYVKARVIPTYKLLSTVPNIDDYEYPEDYEDDVDAISIISRELFTIDSIAVEGMEATTNLLDPLHEIYLHKSLEFTPEDFGLQLLPQADSSFTPEQLDYKLKDLTIIPSDANILEVIQNENPLSYTVTLKNFETWETNQTHIQFVYDENISANIYLKLLVNEIIEGGLYIEKNTEDAIQLTVKDDGSETYDLLANTVIIGQNPEIEATYTTTIYEVDLNQLPNELGESIILANEVTGIIENGIIIPLNRGDTRVRTIVIQTDIDGNPLVKLTSTIGVPLTGLEYYLSEIEGVIEVVSIASDEIVESYEGYAYQNVSESDFVSVSILEELKTLDVLIRTKKVKTFNLLETGIITIDIDNYNTELIKAYKDTKTSEEEGSAPYYGPQFGFRSTNPLVVEITNETIENLTIDLEEDVNNTIVNGININLQALVDGQAFIEVYYIDAVTELEYIIDVIEINVRDEASTGTVHEIELDINRDYKDTFIKSEEGVLLLTPNSYGAFLDAYVYDKIEFIIEHHPDVQALVDTGFMQPLLRINHSIDVNSIITVELIAQDFHAQDDLSYVNIKAIIKDTGYELFGKRIEIESGAVEAIVLEANSDTIAARISSENEIQWLVPVVISDDPLDPDYDVPHPHANEELTLTITFYPLDYEPIVKDVNFFSSDNDILEIDNSGSEPTFMFKAPGTVIITAESLDESHAQSTWELDVKVPVINTLFSYDDIQTQQDIDYEQLTAGLPSVGIDLLTDIVVGGEPRISAETEQGIDRSNILKYEILEGAEFVNIIESFEVINEGEIDEYTIRHWNMTTLAVGSYEVVRLRIYNDLGVGEQIYYFKISPNVTETIAEVGESEGSPEQIYVEKYPIPNLTPIDIGNVVRVLLEQTVEIEGGTELQTISNLTYSIHSRKSVATGEDVTGYGRISGAVLEIGDIPEAINFVIMVSTDFGYNAFFHVLAEPNIEIVLENIVSETGTNGLEYEIMNANSTLDLKAGRVSAATLDADKAGGIRDLTDNLEFSLVGTYDGISIDENTGVITSTSPAEVQWVQVEIKRIDYVVYYYVKVNTI